MKPRTFRPENSGQDETDASDPYRAANGAETPDQVSFENWLWVGALSMLVVQIMNAVLALVHLIPRILRYSSRAETLSAPRE